MASYIYSNAQSAIGGGASGFQKNWSPNKIRALFIMRDFILVVDYLAGPKLTALDVNEVGLDLQNPSRIGSLNNLLSSRQLSCMEEIYVDEAFSMYPGVIDLQAYANSVISSQSRLRYYAYTSGINGAELQKIYYQAFSQGMVDFTYAKNVGGIKYVDTGNTNWYQKHNLRPQYYGPDADGGALAAWFNKVEKVYAKTAKENAEREKELSENEYIMRRVLADVARSGDLALFKRLLRSCNGSRYELHRLVASIMAEQAKSQKPVPGLSKEKIIKAAESAGIRDKNTAEGVMNVTSDYKALGVYIPNSSMDLKKLQENNIYPQEEGFLQVSNMYDRVLAGIYEKCANNPSYRYTVLMAIQSAFPQGVPNGALAKRLAGKTKVIDAPLAKYLQAYKNALFYICGRTESDV